VTAGFKVVVVTGLVTAIDVTAIDVTAIDGTGGGALRPLEHSAKVNVRAQTSTVVAAPRQNERTPVILS
jgi:hypothetical protein